MRLVILGDDGTLYLKRIGQFASLHGEWLGKEGDTLHLLVVCKLLLEGIDAVHHQVVDTLILTEFGHRRVGDVASLCVFLEQFVVGCDEGRHKLTLVGYDDYLVNVAVHHEFRLYHLWSDILAITGLEEVLDTIRQEEFTILNIAGITGVKLSLLVVREGCDLSLAVVAPGDGITLEQHLIILANLYLHALDDTAHRTDGLGAAMEVD